MEQKINSSEFKKHLLLSYIKFKGNCKQFDEFIKLISTTENECHKLIIELMNQNFVKYENNGYEINETMLSDYNYFVFYNGINLNNELKNTNQDAILYLPKSFLNKIKK